MQTVYLIDLCTDSLEDLAEGSIELETTYVLLDVVSWVAFSLSYVPHGFKEEWRQITTLPILMHMLTTLTSKALEKMNTIVFKVHLLPSHFADADSTKATTYLDHAGTTLYAKSLLDAFHLDMVSNLFGNPHSVSPASNLSTLRIDEVRDTVLEYFNTDSKAFDVIFTSSATAAIKLVADCFREQDFDYYYHKDAHSSLVGVRELARNAQCLVSSRHVETFISQGNSTGHLKLFAYPAQSNMTGYRPSLTWSSRVRKHCKNTYVLLDAGTY